MENPGLKKHSSTEPFLKVVSRRTAATTAAYDPERQSWLYDVEEPNYFEKDPAPSSEDNSHQPMMHVKNDVPNYPQEWLDNDTIAPENDMLYDSYGEDDITREDRDANRIRTAAPLVAPRTQGIGGNVVPPEPPTIQENIQTPPPLAGTPSAQPVSATNGANPILQLTDPNGGANRRRIDTQKQVGGGQKENRAYDDAQKLIRDRVQQRRAHPLHKSAEMYNVQHFDDDAEGPSGLRYFRDTDFRPPRLTNDETSSIAYSDQPMFQIKEPSFDEWDSPGKHEPGEACETCYLKHGIQDATRDEHWRAEIENPHEFKPFKSESGQRYSSAREAVVHPPANDPVFPYRPSQNPEEDTVDLDNLQSGDDRFRPHHPDVDRVMNHLQGLPDMSRNDPRLMEQVNEILDEAPDTEEGNRGADALAMGLNTIFDSSKETEGLPREERLQRGKDAIDAHFEASQLSHKEHVKQLHDDWLARGGHKTGEPRPVERFSPKYTKPQQIVPDPSNPFPELESPILYAGKCDGCGKKLWDSADSSGDPRGALGDHTVGTIDAAEYDATDAHPDDPRGERRMHGPSALICPDCDSESEKQNRILDKYRGHKAGDKTGDGYWGVPFGSPAGTKREFIPTTHSKDRKGKWHNPGEKPGSCFECDNGITGFHRRTEPGPGELRSESARQTPGQQGADDFLNSPDYWSLVDDGVHPEHRSVDLPHYRENYDVIPGEDQATWESEPDSAPASGTRGGELDPVHMADRISQEDLHGEDEEYLRNQLVNNYGFQFQQNGEYAKTDEQGNRHHVMLPGDHRRASSISTNFYSPSTEEGITHTHDNVDSALERAAINGEYSEAKVANPHLAYRDHFLSWVRRNPNTYTGQAHRSSRYAAVQDRVSAGVQQRLAHPLHQAAYDDRRRQFLYDVDAGPDYYTKDMPPSAYGHGDQPMFQVKEPVDDEGRLRMEEPHQHPSWQGCENCLRMNDQGDLYGPDDAPHQMYSGAYEHEYKPIEDLPAGVRLAGRTQPGPMQSQAVWSNFLREAHNDFDKNMSDLLGVQGSDGNWDYSPYMHGLYNGMALGAAIHDGPDTEPDYRDAPDTWREDQVTVGERLSVAQDEGDGQPYFRVQPGEHDSSVLLDPESQTSHYWGRDYDQSLTRSGVSAVQSREELARYLATYGQGIPFGSPGWVIVEMRGHQSDDRPNDSAGGEVLIHPTKIVSSKPIDDEFFNMVGHHYDESQRSRTATVHVASESDESTWDMLHERPEGFSLPQFYHQHGLDVSVTPEHNLAYLRDLRNVGPDGAPHGNPSSRQMFSVQPDYYVHHDHDDDTADQRELVDDERFRGNRYDPETEPCVDCWVKGNGVIFKNEHDFNSSGDHPWRGSGGSELSRFGSSTESDEDFWARMEREHPGQQPSGITTGVTPDTTGLSYDHDGDVSDEDEDDVPNNMSLRDHSRLLDSGAMQWDGTTSYPRYTHNLSREIRDSDGNHAFADEGHVIEHNTNHHGPVLPTEDNPDPHVLQYPWSHTYYPAGMSDNEGLTKGYNTPDQALAATYQLSVWGARQPQSQELLKGYRYLGSEQPYDPAQELPHEAAMRREAAYDEARQQFLHPIDDPDYYLKNKPPSSRDATKQPMMKLKDDPYERELEIENPDGEVVVQRDPQPVEDSEGFMISRPLLDDGHYNHHDYQGCLGCLNRDLESKHPDDKIHTRRNPAYSYDHEYEPISDLAPGVRL